MNSFVIINIGAVNNNGTTGGNLLRNLFKKIIIKKNSNILTNESIRQSLLGISAFVRAEMN